MLTERDNLMESIEGGHPEWVPLCYAAIDYCGFLPSGVTEMPSQGGKDIFGVPWVVGREGPLHEPGFVMFEDICDWEDYVKMPDVSQIDIKGMAKTEEEMFGFDRKNKIIYVMDAGGPFNRLTALMGFENALVAMATEPEECKRFCEAYTEYKLDYVKAVIDAYGPDVYCQGDDIATARSTFMSPETYREVLKPYHKAVVDYVKSRGVIPSMHCCGRVEDLLDDYVDIGLRIWQSAQSMNDISGILDKYRGVLAVEGGWSATPEASLLLDPDDPGDNLRVEVRRILGEYKKPGYIGWPIVFNDRGNMQVVGDERISVIIDEWEKYKWF